MDKIIVNGIEITIYKKKIKNLYIRIKPPLGEVCISVPQCMSLGQIKQFANSKIEWIIAHRENIGKQPLQPDLSYVSGDLIPYHGKYLKLSIIHSKRTYIDINQEEIQLYIRDNSTAEQREKVLNNWYRCAMKQEADEMVEKWQKMIGVRASGVGIKNMKTRWGTCNVKTGKIWLSLRLIQKAPHFLEYVVVHELVHLLEKSHNQVFKGYMDRFLPRWRAIRKELNTGL